MYRLLLIPAFLVLLSAAALMWSSDKPTEKPDFTFINRGDIKTLDVNRLSWMQDIRIGLGLWEGLYRLDPATLDPELGTAESAEMVDTKLEDGSTQRVWTFKIRPTARWTNGDDVTSHDFAFGWRRMLEQPDEYTNLIYYIKGAKKYQEAYDEYHSNAYPQWYAAHKTWTENKQNLSSEPAKPPPPDFFKIVGVETKDAKTLVVTLSDPIPFFPDLCAFPCYFPQHEKSMAPFRIEDPETGRYLYRGQFTLPPNLVSNGPFRLDFWQFKGRLRMVASDHYWDRANVKSRIVDQIYGDKQIAFEMYERGEIDWLSDVEPEIAFNLRKAGRKDLRVGPSFGTYFYSFNCLPTLPDGRKNPLVDPRVRQALTMAIDKRPIVETVTRMGEPVTTNYIPPGVFKGFKSPPGLAYDPEQARKLMAEAGFPGGKGFPKLSILFNNEAHHGDVAQIVRRQWLKELGIDVSLEGVEIKIFGDRLHRQQYSIARASWYGDYNDPSTFTDKYRSDSEQNDAKWANERFDELCNLTSKEPDADKRLRLFEQAEDLLLREAPIIPMYTYVNVYLHRDDVHGIVMNPKNMLQWKGVWSESRKNK